MPSVERRPCPASGSTRWRRHRVSTCDRAVCAWPPWPPRSSPPTSVLVSADTRRWPRCSGPRTTGDVTGCGSPGCSPKTSYATSCGSRLRKGATPTAIARVRDRWVAGGGNPEPPFGGASPRDRLSRPAGSQPIVARRARSPPRRQQRVGTKRLAAGSWPRLAPRWAQGQPPPPPPSVGYRSTSATGSWGHGSGRAVACVLGKPVEKVPRAGIEAILRSTGRWPPRPVLHRRRARS